MSSSSSTTLSSSYRAVVIDSPGGYDKLQIKTMQGNGSSGANLDPTSKDNVIVEVRYTAINYADVCIRWGLYESAKKYVGWPITPGFEFTGVVVDAGNSDLKLGSWVVGVSMFGGYTTRIIVPRTQLLPFNPKLIPPEVAAGLPCAALTAWYALFMLATPGTSPGGTEGVGRKRRLLIHSAAGGVGSMICRLAKLKGVDKLNHNHVVGIVGAQAKVEKLKAWNCCDIIVSKEECKLRGVNFWQEVDRLSPGGFDAVFDANGVSTLTGSYDHLKAEGRLITYGFHSTLPKKGGRLTMCQWIRMGYDYYFKQKNFDAMDMVPSNKSVLGFNLSFLFERTDLYVEVMSRVLKFVESGEIKIDKGDVQIFNLGDIALAHQSIESGLTTGKLVLCTRDELKKVA